MSPHHSDTPIEIGLAAAVVAVERGQPQILVTGSDTDGEALPYGRFDPLAHRTLEIALRDFVTTQTGLSLGYVEQLYTFADRGRHADLSRRSCGITWADSSATPRAEDSGYYCT